MSDRFLFRGKRILSSADGEPGDWVVGYLLKGIYDETLIIPINEHYSRRIDPATIGQCTGLRDTSGKLIFEGDIVITPQGLGLKARVFYNASDCAYLLEYKCVRDTDRLGKYSSLFIKIIGNIHDDLGLLEVRDD